MFNGFPTCQNVQAHSVANRIVENEREKIEGENGVKALRQLLKEGGQVALLRDGLADLQESFELPPGMLDGRRSLRLLRGV